jgi:DnaJ-class molecular chaperone
MGNMMMRQQQRVPSKEKCKMVDTHLTAVVEKGMTDGTEIKFERMNQESPGKIPGDVILVVQQKPHESLKRQGNDLHIKMPISLKESLLGFSKQLTHLDGHKVLVQGKGVTRPLEVKKIKNEGMPFHTVPSQQGELHVTVEVLYPAKLTKKQQKAITKHF